MRKAFASLLLAATLGLAACSAAQQQAAQSALTGTAALVQQACTGALAAAADAQGVVKGGAANTVASITTNYLTPGCVGADAVAQIAQNPTTLQWLGQITGQLNTLAAIAKGTTPAPAAAPAAAPATAPSAS